jgi:rhamnose transport system ATP-binding protein
MAASFPASAPLLSLRRAAKSFGGVRALRGVDFELRPGEVHALLGENGAGKSTLIKLITGAHQPDAGELHVGGERVEHLTPQRAQRLGIACIYQQPALFPDLSVAENIALRLGPPRPWQRIDWAERRRQAERAFELAGARIDPDAEVRSLSMPEQQLVEIACALGTGARIVIMDEPTASLTRQEQEQLFRIVRDLRTRGVGVIYISHRLEEIFALADRVTVLRDGESVGTHATADLNEAALIKLMVGREVNLLYPPADAAPGGTVLEVRHVSCAAGGVRDVSFSVRAGEVFGLAGLVGAGRTELARTLFGLTPADAGEIRLGGQTLTIGSPRDAVRHGIAYVPEDRRRHGVVLEMPVAQNMTMAIHPRLFPGAWLRLGAEESLAREFARAGVHPRSRGEMCRPRGAGRQLERRQPAEGLAGALAGDEAPTLDPRRADAGRGRRREERDPPDRAPARAARPRRDFDFERSSRSARHERSHRRDARRRTRRHAAGRLGRTDGARRRPGAGG